jgi:hypothetical protein
MSIGRQGINVAEVARQLFSELLFLKPDFLIKSTPRLLPSSPSPPEIP